MNNNKVRGGFKLSDGRLVDVCVDWFPLDMSAEAVAERKKIERETEGGM